MLDFKGQNVSLPFYFGTEAGPGGGGRVWVRMIVTRWILGLFCGKRSAGLQSLFRDFPDDLSKEPRDVSPAFSPHPYCTRESHGALGLKWGRRAGHRVESTLLNC